MAALNLRFRCPVFSLASGFVRMSSMPKQQKALADAQSCSMSAISCEQVAHGSSQNLSYGEDFRLQRAGKFQVLDGQLMSSCSASNDDAFAEAHVSRCRLVENAVENGGFLGDDAHCESLYQGSFQHSGNSLNSSDRFLTSTSDTNVNTNGESLCSTNPKTNVDQTDTINGADTANAMCGLAEPNVMCNAETANAKPIRTGSSAIPSGSVPSKSKRPFCMKCWKAQKLCICKRFKGVVQNRTRVTILQSPDEKFHAVGSARVVMLGLKSVALVDVPEIYSLGTFRVRPKIPGSKRSLANRGGKKLHLEEGNTILHSEIDMLQVIDSFMEVFKDTSFMEHCSNESTDDSTTVHGKLDYISHHCELLKDKLQKFKLSKLSGSCTEGDNSNSLVPDMILKELNSLIPPGVALLYPSDYAIELTEEVLSNTNHDRPSHLIVLDGTWSKARRVYFENPWLEAIPHYKLSHIAESIYEGVRKEPRPGCLSTVESIVFALKVLEPETKGLENLLEVFDSMVEDQRRFQQMKSNISNAKT